MRKRFLPVALLFKTRARDGEKLKAELFADPVAVSVGHRHRNWHLQSTIKRRGRRH